MSPSQQRHLYEYVYNMNTQRENFDTLEKKLIAYVFLMFSNIFFNDSLSKNNADFFPRLSIVFKDHCFTLNLNLRTALK